MQFIGGYMCKRVVVMWLSWVGLFCVRACCCLCISLVDGSACERVVVYVDFIGVCVCASMLL